MKNTKSLCLMSTLTLLAGCAGMQKKPDVYVPEEKKVISYSDSVPRVDNKIKGSHIVITKHPLLGKTFETQECVVAAPVQAETAVAPQPQPQGLGGLLSSLSNAVKETTKKTSSIGPKETAPQATKTITENFFENDEAIVFEINYASDINHIVNFSGVTFILEDPNGEQYRPVSAKNLLNRKGFSCGTKEQIDAFTKTTKNITDFNKSVVLPKGSITTALAFRPGSKKIKGNWKLSMYEVPVLTDPAGKVSETDHWHGNMIVKKWETTFKRFEKGGDMKEVSKVQL